MPDPVRLSAYQVVQDICFATEVIPAFAKLAHAGTCTMPHLPAHSEGFAI